MTYIYNFYMDKFAVPKKNIYLILIGLGVMVLGFVLMTGGGSTDPNVFNYDMFSFRRIVLAPLLVLAGVVIEIVAIIKKPKQNKENE